MHTVTDKFHEIEEKMNDMNAQYTLFADQIESVTYGDVPDLQAQIDDLLDQQGIGQMELDELKKKVGECTERIEKTDKENEELQLEKDVAMKEEKREIQRYLDTLRGLVEGTPPPILLLRLILLTVPGV